MAREYARIMTAIWDNREFCHLDENEQRAYLLLVTQPDISAAGVLRLWVPRWAEMSRSSSVESMTQALKGLEAARFIVVDWVSGELLIRSFVRWDAGFNNPKRRPVIVRAGKEVRSETIREHLRFEFKRCGLLPEPPPTPNGPRPDTTSGTAPDAHADSLSKITKVDPGKEPFPQVDSLSDSYAPENGVVVTEVTTGDTTTHNPQPVPPTAGAEAPPADERGEAEAVTAGTLVGEWIADCRKRPPDTVVGQTSKTIRLMLVEGIDPDDIRAGLATWKAKGLHPSALPAVVNEVMNAGPRLHVLQGSSSPAAHVPAAYGWQALKSTGTDDRPLRALPGSEPTC